MEIILIHTVEDLGVWCSSFLLCNLINSRQLRLCMAVSVTPSLLK